MPAFPELTTEIESNQSRRIRPWMNFFRMTGCLLIAAYTLPICQAQSSKPPVGILIYKGSPGDSAEYYSGVLYWSAEYQGVRYSFDTRQGRPFVIFKDLIASAAEFEIPGKGNVYQMNIQSEADVQTIESFSRSLAALVPPSPKLAAVVKPVCREFESWITNFRGGSVRINGIWKSSLDVAAESASRMEKTVVISGISYESPQFSGLQDGYLRFTHAGGVARLHVSKLSAAEKMLLSSKFGIDVLALESSADNPAGMAAATGQPAVPVPQTPERTAIYEAKGIGGNLEAARADAERLCLLLAAADYEAAGPAQKVEHFINNHSQDLRVDVIKAVRKLASKHDAKGVSIIIRAEIAADKLNAKLAENRKSLP